MACKASLERAMRGSRVAAARAGRGATTNLCCNKYLALGRTLGSYAACTFGLFAAVVQAEWPAALHLYCQCTTQVVCCLWTVGCRITNVKLQYCMERLPCKTYCKILATLIVLQDLSCSRICLAFPI